MNVMCKFKNKICLVTRCLILHCILVYYISRDLNTLIYNAKNMAHLKKISSPPPPWFENAPPPYAIMQFKSFIVNFFYDIILIYSLLKFAITNLQIMRQIQEVEMTYFLYHLKVTAPFLVTVIQAVLHSIVGYF